LEDSKTTNTVKGAGLSRTILFYRENLLMERFLMENLSGDKMVKIIFIQGNLIKKCNSMAKVNLT
jgi:hypothetical protein